MLNRWIHKIRDEQEVTVKCEKFDLGSTRDLTLKNGRCIYCPSDGPFSTVQHIFPESLHNGGFVIRNAVCDKCQKYFGTKVESFVLNKTLFALPRYIFHAKNKKRKPAKIDWTLSRDPGGALPADSLSHTNFKLDNAKHGLARITHVERGPKTGSLPPNTLRIVITPQALRLMGQFCLKVGLETLALNSPNFVRSTKLNAARDYARYGIPNGQFWPLYTQNVNRSLWTGLMSVTIEPVVNGQIWCELDVSVFRCRFDLLSPTVHNAPRKYIKLNPAPTSDRQSI